MNKGKYSTRKTCRFCKNTDLILVIDLGMMPLAGEFIKKREIGKEKFYPLRVYECQNCGLVQLLDIVPRDELFQSYLSSVALSKHFKHYAVEMRNRFLNKGDFVVEIGSNDGVLLKPLQDLGIKVLGIEPVKKIARLTKKRGILTKVKYFSHDLARSIKDKPKVVFANNVFAHIDDMDDMMNGIDYLLEDNGVFVFEVHHLLNLVTQLQFDNIYHEHLSYYNISTLAPFLAKYGFEIFEVRPIETFGGSIRVYTRKVSKDLLRNMQKNIQNKKISLLMLLDTLKEEDATIVGFGAAGRANTLLNFCGIDTKYLDYIIDESPERYGKYTPGTHIKIVPLEGLNLDNVDYILILAWNYEKQIRAKLKDFKGKFIIPLPEWRII